ncbi:MAG: hypothetical protein JWP52_2615, partial [Rhizobacter sp.]|nr:hypothetical protein [Rhizobacter sp.]
MNFNTLLSRSPAVVCGALRPIAVAGLLGFIALGAVAGPKSVPFKATLAITESVNFVFAPPCFAIGTLTASGQASHLGRVTGSSQDCINPTGVFDPNGPNSFRFTSGVSGNGVVLTSANGDSLYLAYSGTLTAQPTGPHEIEGDFIVVGGTGRFEGAAGGGTVTGTED